MPVVLEHARVELHRHVWGRQGEAEGPQSQQGEEAGRTVQSRGSIREH